MPLVKPEIVLAPCEGADLVLDAFLRHHVKHVFIFPGGTIAPILDRIEKRSEIEIVCPRTEQGAGYAALAYARMTGETAVFMVTSGPGVTNAVTPIADKAGLLFYERLITLDPSLKPLFKGDIPEQSRKLMQMITVAVNGLDKLETIVPAVQALGARHARYGVVDAHYDIVAAALLWTLERGLGPVNEWVYATSPLATSLA